MDELLTFMEEDLAYDDEPDDDPRVPDPSCRRMGSSPLKSRNGISESSQEKKSQEVTFKDIFGSPDKRDVRELGLSQSGKSVRSLDFGASQSPATSISSRLSDSKLESPLPSSSQLELQRAIRQDKNVPYKADSSLVVIDPFSRVRVIKSTVSIYFDETVSAEAVLKDRNIGLEFVSLPTTSVWYRGKGKDTKNFWVSGVLVKKTTGIKKSAKGNDYTIWEINDLKDLDKKFTVFLFGSSSGSTTLASIPTGSVVDLTTPMIMQDTDNGGIKFSINNANQVRFIATAKDFGICQGKKKDGNKCSNVVNTWECSFCIHHASAELKKLNIGGSGGRKGKGKANNGFFPNKSFGGEGETQESLKQQGIFVSDFGRQPTAIAIGNKSFGGKTPAAAKPFYSSRMELQGSNTEMKKNHIRFGNSDTITFVKNTDHPLLKKEPVPAQVRKPLDLNPYKTRHLTDKDRDLLQMLDSKAINGTPAKEDKKELPTTSSQKRKSAPAAPVVSEMITSQIVSNPNAAGRNFMQFLTLQHAPKDQVDLTSANKSTKLNTLIMTREKIKSMEKALNFVKSNGPIQKSNPNAVPSKKRKISPGSSPSASSQPGPSTKRRSTPKIDIEFDFESDDFKKILNAKSAHDDELDEIKHEEYFDKHEKKEALENKLLSTYSIETNAVLCQQCKYIALSQSDFCKQLMHQVRLVKARKRFFKCKDCGNRTMSLDRLPKRPCTNCNSSSWLVAPVGRERKGPTLPSEMLSVRGNEEKFIGSAGAKHFLHLEM